MARSYLGRSNVECALRRRIADTLNAAAFLAAGVAVVATCNAGDFELFDELRVVNPCEGDARDA